MDRNKIAEQAIHTRRKVINKEFNGLDLYDRILINNALQLLEVCLRDGVGLEQGASLAGTYKVMRSIEKRYG